MTDRAQINDASTRQSHVLNDMFENDYKNNANICKEPVRPLRRYDKVIALRDYVINFEHWQARQTLALGDCVSSLCSCQCQ